ncbi:GTPase IMAP family member 7-like [Phyllostomus hastatus]|uniref:GTPase IMAP family member 7-like n=1 Tax=Phyllostomus hastatus TaxID=9423 RepID=UPI001E68374A|nr:GTPase IMAP family member 7-like [Phyllostomus hastatus]
MADTCADVLIGQHPAVVRVFGILSDSSFQPVGLELLSRRSFIGENPGTPQRVEGKVSLTETQPCREDLLPPSPTTDCQHNLQFCQTWRGQTASHIGNRGSCRNLHPEPLEPAWPAFRTTLFGSFWWEELEVEKVQQQTASWGKVYLILEVVPVSVTKSCQKASRAWKGRNLVVVDTPGLFDTKKTLIFTCDEISKCVLHSSPGPHAIILVLQLARATEEEYNTIKLIQAIFGKRAMKHMMILFTCKDLLDKDQDVSSSVGEADERFKTLIEEFGNRYCAFNNRSADEAEKEAQLQELVELIEAIVQENGGTHFSDPIYEYTAEKVKRLEEALEKIHAERSEKEKLIQELYARGKIKEKEMNEQMISLKEKCDKQSKTTKEEGEKSIIAGIFNWIKSLLASLWSELWK